MNEIGHVVLFGSGRPFHVIARRLARDAGAEVVCLEEGYIRPGFVTVEAGGNNASSPFAGKLPPEAAPLAKDVRRADFGSFRSMCWYGAAYYAARTVLSLPSERHHFHRRFAAVPELFYWSRNFWRRLAHRNADFAVIERLLEHHEGRYFLVPLQVASDEQLKAPARGWSGARLIDEVLRSFARKALDSHHLVFKIHPLQRGHGDERKQVRNLAESLGVADRVHVLGTGSVGLLTRHSRGVITINSTSGLSAIHHGVPLLVIGDALYANEQLAVCARGLPDFDAFWTCTKVAEADLRERYLGWIRKNCLKPGDFYARAGMDAASAGVLQMIRTLTGSIASERKAAEGRWRRAA